MRAALRREADRRGTFLSDDVMDYVMTRFARDLKHLMAQLDRLDEFSLATKRAITVPLLKQMLAEEARRRERAPLCLFDLDHTLLPIDSDHAWGEFMISLGWVDAAAVPARQRRLLRRVPGRPARHRRLHRLRDGAVARAQRAERARRAGALHARGDRAGDPAAPRARWSRRTATRGDRLALVTATNDFVTAPIAAAFAIDDPDRDPPRARRRGALTGRIDGTPRYREGKVARVGQWLAADGRGWGDFERISVYSDSLNDLSAARAGDRPGRHQSFAGARGRRPRARLAHPHTLRMIKQFISKLLGKSAEPPAARRAASASRCRSRSTASTRRSSTSAPSRSSRRSSRPATRPTSSAARCATCCVGLRPKDFDVATNATPEQVKGLFRRAFIIGRRFRIVHVVFGRGRQDRGLSEVIEVSTFRAMLAAADAEQVTGNEKTSRKDLVDKTHVVDAEGRVLRDNVWGPQIEDAARRDFTVNAMYYDPVREIVVDYHGGIKDAKKKLLRMIGDPVARYREDPVRIIRAVRFAAKLGFEIEPKTRAPIKEMAALLDNVPQSRTFDEMIKLLQTGHALASIVELKKLGLHRGVFPVLDVALDEAQRHDGREKFVRARARRHRRARRRRQAGRAELHARGDALARRAGGLEAAPGGRRSAVPGPAGGDRRRLRCAHRRHLRPRQAGRRHARDLDAAAALRAPRRAARR